MGLKETKYYYENMFKTLWTSTPIHFAAQEFDKKIKTTGEWVNLIYKPTSLVTSSFSGKKAYGLVYVVCWSDNDVRSMEIADEVIKFIQENNDSLLYSIKNIEIVDHGWQTASSAFTILSFRVEYYEDQCPLSSPECVDSIGTETGREWVMVNSLKNNCILCKG